MTSFKSLPNAIASPPHSSSMWAASCIRHHPLLTCSKAVAAAAAAALEGRLVPGSLSTRALQHTTYAHRMKALGGLLCKQQRTLSQVFMLAILTLSERSFYIQRDVYILTHTPRMISWCQRLSKGEGLLSGMLHFLLCVFGMLAHAKCL